MPSARQLDDLLARYVADFVARNAAARWQTAPLKPRLSRAGTHI